MTRSPHSDAVFDEARTRSQYAYTRGLDYLRRRSREHVAIADALTQLWPLDEKQRPDFDLCDYGTGFGDLCVATLQALDNHFDKPVNFQIDVVDSDLSLLAYAGTALQACGFHPHKLTPHAFEEREQRYDLILASHVLYYVPDRLTAIKGLARRLRPGGQLVVILRSDACDTYIIRSAVRQAPGVVPPEPGRPRLHVNDVETMLQGAGLRQSTDEILTTFEVPVEDVRHGDLYSNAPTTDATEFIRFVGHIPASPKPRRSAVLAIEQELAKRRSRDSYVFRIATSIVTGRAGEA